MKTRIAASTLGPVVLALGLSCSSPPPPSPNEVQVIDREEVLVDPLDPAWEEAPAHPAELLLQDLVEPRLLEASTARVVVRAVTDRDRIAFRLDWEDATQDDVPRPSRFVDACAVQLPRDPAADVPAPQMGEEGRAVEITFWRASWQASVHGREDSIRSLYPGASVDHYPFEAPSLEPGSEAQRGLASAYAPARALGNRMEGPRERPVEDLIAEGPGTLSPAARQISDGNGRRRGAGWSVVIVRPLPPALEGAGRTQVAFAVWDGSAEEAGARKMRTGWIPLRIGRRT